MIQFVAFIFWAVFFICWERMRPARPHAQKAQWVSDLLVLGFVAVSSTLTLWILHQFGEHLPHGILGLQALPLALRIFLGILAYDFTIYWIHRSMHHVPFLWRIHRWHHSIENSRSGS
jgi:sterol desaturase/sphingolipid hydroxylase (fatty acid hydroxylase superfamily)